MLYAQSWTTMGEGPYAFAEEEDEAAQKALKAFTLRYAYVVRTGIHADMKTLEFVTIKIYQARQCRAYVPELDRVYDGYVCGPRLNCELTYSIQKNASAQKDEDTMSFTLVRRQHVSGYW
jgi:hypothetical protein